MRKKLGKNKKRKRVCCVHTRAGGGGGRVVTSDSWRWIWRGIEPIHTYSWLSFISSRSLSPQFFL